LNGGLTPFKVYVDRKSKMTATTGQHFAIVLFVFLKPVNHLKRSLEVHTNKSYIDGPIRNSKMTTTAGVNLA
jgi:hypothetical protein